MKQFFNLWMLAGSLLVALLLLAGLFLILGPVNRSAPREFTGEVVITVIPRPTPTSQPTATEPVLTPSPASNEAVETGSYVQIRGTGGEGLRLREQPSLSASTNYVGLEDEVFLVLEGPRNQDGYLWWLLEAPADPARNGWAVSNYLLKVQSP